MNTPAMPELSRWDIIDLISPQSKNSADHDIEFAYRVIAALSSQPSPEQAGVSAQQAVPMTGEQIIDIAAEWSNQDFANGAWRFCTDFARAIEAHHGITAQSAQEGV